MASPQIRNSNLKLGERLVQHRKRIGLSQSKLARQLEVAPQSVWKWENGLAQPRTKYVMQMAEIFGVPVEDLALSRRDSHLSSKAIDVGLTYDALPKEGKLWLDYTLRRLQEVYGLKRGHPSGEQKGQKGHNSNEPKGQTPPGYVMSPQPRSDGEVFRGGPPMFDTDWPLLGAQTLSHTSLS
jgi:transcriptional regulator with XRE-family HTH domain